MTSEHVTGAAEQYETDGYARVQDVLDRDLIEEARRHVGWLRERNPDRRPENLDYDLVQRDAFWVRLISDDRLLDIAEAFLGPDVALFASHYIAKPPGDGQPVLWHQDGVYWPLEPDRDVITIWLALDESTPENGCMRVIPGTQTMAFHDLEERTDVENVLNSEIAIEVNESDAVDIELEPGDVSVHHPAILHGSEGNTSERWRRGLTIRYIPTTTRITERSWPACFLLRGSPEPGVNTYQPWPLYGPDANTSMEFADWEAYNERATAMNERVDEAGYLADE